MKNSKAFKEMLEKMCDLKPISCREQIIEFPFKELWEKLVVDDCRCSIKKLDNSRLFSESEFSVEQVIWGCIHALKFDKEEAWVRFEDARISRNAAPLKKNQSRVIDRALDRARAALCLGEATPANAHRLIMLAVQAQHKKYQKQITDKPVPIRVHKYGCAWYSRDLLTTRKPEIALLLMLNLDYIFSHWPIHPETFPKWPPQAPITRRLKFIREKDPDFVGPPQAIPQMICNNRRGINDVIAHFVSALFPQGDSSYDGEQVKCKLNQLKENGAIFCNW